MILDAPTCAAMLRCSISHLNRLARQGIVPATKVGRGWIFIETEVLEWVRLRGVVKPVVVSRPAGRPRKKVV